MNAIWWRGLIVPALAVIVAVALWLAGEPAVGVLLLAIALVAIVAWHVHQLSRVTRWAAGPIEGPVPDARGIWGIAFGALHRRARVRTAHQRDLRHRLERFVSGADALPEGVVVLDAQDRIAWANPCAANHLGIDPRRDVGSPIVNFVRQPAFVQYLAGGDHREPVVMPSMREASILSIQIVPFGDTEKLLMSRDITQVEAVARMRRDFIANVSHELKTPLTVLTGFLETFADVDLDKRQRLRYIALMQEQSKSMQRVVDDLLTLSALESEQSAAPELPFDIVPLLLQVSADAKALSAGRHEVTLAFEPSIVKGSRDELASAFGNLVSNAVRYTPERGAIALEWRVRDDGSGEFSVADTGIGIGPEHIPRLTERFYRVDRSRSRATGGTGLGLAIVKHVLIRHQAELDVTSEPGRGSRFAVRLPPKRVERIATERESSDARHIAKSAERDER